MGLLTVNEKMNGEYKSNENHSENAQIDEKDCL